MSKKTPSDPPKRFRAQLTDPVTGRRFSLYADDAPGLAHRVARVRAIRDDLKAGVINRAQAIELIRPFVAGPLTVRSAYERYMATLKPESRRIALSNWKSRLDKWFGTKSPHELTREKLAAWQIDLQAQNVASATIKNTYDQLAACCRLLVDGGELDGLPWGDISRHQGGSGWRPDKVVGRKKMRAATTINEVAALVAVARADDLTHWQRGEYSDRSLVLAVLILTGMRQGEACALSWDSCSLDTAPPILRITHQAKRGWAKRTGGNRPNDPTKTRTDRSQVMHPTVVQVLRAQRAELMRRGWYHYDGPVFPGREGNWRTSGIVIKPERVRVYARAAGFPFWADWVTHSTRHSFASLEVVASRGNLKATQARTGHADVKQLEVYLHAAGQLLGESAVPELPPPVPVIGELPDGAGDIIAADPWGITQIEGAPPVQLVDLKRAEQYESEKRLQRAERQARARRPFAEIALDWIARGCPGEGRGRRRKGAAAVPLEVYELGRRAYSRNYRAAERAGEPVEKCRGKGERGRIAVYAAWNKALKAQLSARRLLPSIPPDPPPPLTA